MLKGVWEAQLATMPLATLPPLVVRLPQLRTMKALLACQAAYYQGKALEISSSSAQCIYPVSKRAGPARNISVHVFDEQPIASVSDLCICIPPVNSQRRISKFWHGAKQGSTGLAGC